MLLVSRRQTTNTTVRSQESNLFHLYYYMYFSICLQVGCTLSAVLLCSQPTSMYENFIRISEN